MELLDIRNEDGSLTGQVMEREEVHSSGALHGTSHVWLIREKKGGSCDVLLQKRAKDKDAYPGCFDISSAGHIPAGQDYLESAIRELYEELGIRAGEEELIFIGMHSAFCREIFHGKPFLNNEVSKVYIYKEEIRDEDIRIQEEELESVLWMDLEECLKEVLAKNPKFCVFADELLMIKKWCQACA